MESYNYFKEKFSSEIKVKWTFIGFQEAELKCS